MYRRRRSQAARCWPVWEHQERRQWMAGGWSAWTSQRAAAEGSSQLSACSRVEHRRRGEVCTKDDNSVSQERDLSHSCAICMGGSGLGSGVFCPRGCGTETRVSGGDRVRIWKVATRWLSHFGGGAIQRAGCNDPYSEIFMVALRSFLLPCFSFHPPERPRPRRPKATTRSSGWKKSKAKRPCRGYGQKTTEPPRDTPPTLSRRRQSESGLRMTLTTRFRRCPSAESGCTISGVTESTLVASGVVPRGIPTVPTRPKVGSHLDVDTLAEAEGELGLAWRVVPAPHVRTVPCESLAGR